MKKVLILAIMAVLMLPFMATAGELSDYVKQLSIEAKADPSGFKARVRARFEAFGEKVDVVLSNMDDPADAFMTLKIGELADKDPVRVMRTVKANKGKGWGVIAKEMGIKPGSKEFHALRSGEMKDKEDRKGKKENKSRGNSKKRK
ncbi:hypothetical protein ACFLZI_01890 [Nitrospirota bacterium]